MLFSLGGDLGAGVELSGELAGGDASHAPPKSIDGASLLNDEGLVARDVRASLTGVRGSGATR